MQLSLPEISDLSTEPAHVLKSYGADDASNPIKAGLARNCILARRLIEKGVRFVQLFNGAYASGGELNWDGHNKLKEQYDKHAVILDQPAAALIRDLKQRGLLEDTLVAEEHRKGDPARNIVEASRLLRNDFIDRQLAALKVQPARPGLPAGAVEILNRLAELRRATLVPLT